MSTKNDSADENEIVIAVDGTSAAGKSNCQTVAARLGFVLLETGSIYRAVTMLAQRERVSPKNHDRAAVFVERILPRIAFTNGSITIDGKSPGIALRTPEVTSAVPFFAEQPRIRHLIVPLQRLFAKGKKVVAEGRDMSSVVFPKAQVKFFLTADPMVRARRRLAQYRKENPACGITFEEVLAKNSERDRLDMNRAESPLICVADAKLIDTTHLTQDEVVDLMLCHCCVNLKL